MDAQVPYRVTSAAAVNREEAMGSLFVAVCYDTIENQDPSEMSITPSSVRTTHRELLGFFRSVLAAP